MKIFGGTQGVGRAFDPGAPGSSGCGGLVKYEEVYLRDYQTPVEARLGRYFGYYNLRQYRSLVRRGPSSVDGLAEPGAGERLLVRPVRRYRSETPAFAKASAGRGDGGSVAQSAAVVEGARERPEQQQRECYPWQRFHLIPGWKPASAWGQDNKEEEPWQQDTS
ncbi:MAG: hypothetical protein WBC53_01005 [Phycisphaerae bacterium]